MRLKASICNIDGIPLIYQYIDILEHSYNTVQLIKTPINKVYNRWIYEVSKVQEIQKHPYKGLSILYNILKELDLHYIVAEETQKADINFIYNMKG